MEWASWPVLIGETKEERSIQCSCCHWGGGVVWGTPLTHTPQQCCLWYSEFLLPQTCNSIGQCTIATHSTYDKGALCFWEWYEAESNGGLKGTHTHGVCICSETQNLQTNVHPISASSSCAQITKDLMVQTVGKKAWQHLFPTHTQTVAKKACSAPLPHTHANSR